jgi:hypothetical protein
MLKGLCADTLQIQQRPFSFKVTEGEELKEFW